MSWITTAIVVGVALIVFLVVYKFMKSREEKKAEELESSDQE